MSRVSGDPQRLRGFPTAVLPARDETFAAVDDYRSALIAFTASPNDVATPDLPDLGPAIDEVLFQLTELGATVEVFADELEALDARGSGVRTVPAAAAAGFLSRVRRRTGELLRSSTDQATHWSLAVHGARASVHGSRFVVNGHRLLLLRREATFAGHLLPPGVPGRLATIDRMRDGLAPHLRGAGGATRDSANALRTSRPITRAGEWMSSATSGPGKWLRVGSRSLGFVGAAYSAGESIARYRQGDLGGSAASAAMAAGGGMMLFPPTALAGAVIVGGALLYENREAVADAGRWAADRVSSAGTAVGEKLSGVGGAISDSAASATSAARGVASRVKGWFD